LHLGSIRPSISPSAYLILAPTSRSLTANHRDALIIPSDCKESTLAVIFRQHLCSLAVRAVSSGATSSCWGTLLLQLVISHTAIVSCLGNGRAASASALRERRSGLAPCTFEGVDLAMHVGQVADADLRPVPVRLSRFDCRNNRLAQLGLLQDGFVATIKAAAARYGSDRIGVFLGTSTSGILQTELAYRRRDAVTGALPLDFDYAHTHNPFSLSHFVRSYLELAGPALVVSTACSSSAKVFANAARAIKAGLCDAAVIGGVDSLCLTTLYGFASLGLVSNEPCRPFDADRAGISIGEAAGFALMEKASDHNREAIRFLGAGESADAYHMSTPHPEGLGARMAMERALANASLRAADIDYINLHGTASRTNDSAEEKAVFDLFGDRTPCSSTKGWTGHALGAAGITEAIICALALETGLLPGSVHTRQLDPQCRVDYLLENRPVSPRLVMSNSFGFGGTNCCVILGRAQ
jgi:3-oxoacyl-[acyl-carrier-protein] synthase I